MLRSLLNPVFEKVTADSVTTEQITDSTDGQAYETLRELGFKKGDYLPLISGSMHGIRTSSTSNDRYDNAYDMALGSLTWDLISPSSGTTVVWFECRVNILNGTTASIRLRNADDNEVMLEETGISSKGLLTIGPTEYTPTTNSSQIQYRLELRSGDGNSEVEIKDGTPIIGVQL
jgi:hypothetical protein